MELGRLTFRASVPGLASECAKDRVTSHEDEVEVGGSLSRHMSGTWHMPTDGTGWEALAPTSCGTESNRVLVKGALHRIAIIHCWERKKGIV